MNKINKIVVLLIGMILPLANAQADVASDMASNLSYEQVVKNGLSAGMPMSVVLVKMFSASHDDKYLSIVSAAVSVSPKQAGLVVRTAIRAGADPEEVVTEATAVAPKQNKAIIQAAIASGADVLDVTLASAEGIARSGVKLDESGVLGGLEESVALFEPYSSAINQKRPPGVPPASLPENVSPN